jgi:hypothetical protein
MRVQVRRQELESGAVIWRIAESDGQPVCRWLPDEPIVRPLDGGGFENYSDARGFSLGVDLIRSEHGLLSDADALEVRAERDLQDVDQRGRPRKLSPDIRQFVAA